MSKACISRNVDQVTIISSSGQATAPAVQVRDQNFPTGDVAIEALHIRYDAAISGTSTPTRITNGHLFWLNSITVQTDKHGKIVDSVDGLLLYIRNFFDYGTAPLNTALSSTPADTDTPAASWIVPFALFHGLRPYDTHLDMQVSRMKVFTTYGQPCGTSGNLFTQAGGSPLAKSLVQSIEAKVLPGPLATGAGADGGGSELPVYLSTFEQMLIPITASQNRFQIALPFGDRIYRRIFITQRNTSDKTEMSNVIAATANISLYINNIPIVDQRRFNDIQSANKLEYSIETLPTGVCVLDFDSVFEERFNDMLFALTLNSGSMYLYIDVTTQTNGGVLLGLDCLKPIPPAAQRG